MPEVNVDSANTTAIEYDSYGSTPWALTQVANNGGVFAQTLTRAQSTGGAVFRFHGTRVQVYGTLTVPSVSGATVVSTYAVDGGADAAASFSSASIPDSLIKEIDGQLFFNSGTLADSDHVLVLNVTTASNGAPYLLDYIKYEATASASSGSTSTSTSSGESEMATGSSTSTSVAGGGSKHANVGPIVGGAVGGVLGVLLVALAVFLYLRYFQHRVTLRSRERGGKDLIEDLIGDEPKSDTGLSSTHGLTDLSGTTLRPPTDPLAPSTIGPEDSASQVAGRLYAAELGLHVPPPGISAPHPSRTSSSGAASKSAQDSRSSANGAGRSYRGRKGPGLPPAVAEEEPEGMQHEDSGIRFRDGEMRSGIGDDLNEEPPPDYNNAAAAR